MPNEPAESDFRTKVTARAYAAAEYAGLVWIYMGPAERKPPLPLYQWCTRPDADQTTGTKWMQESNYAQALEGNIDSSHVGFLHKTFDHPTFRSGGRLQFHVEGSRTSAEQHCQHDDHAECGLQHAGAGGHGGQRSA
jgi:phenylpropionate dioxygenase-like ring-hydroxylating dioxygenase large terminal subunit